MTGRFGDTTLIEHLRARAAERLAGELAEGERRPKWADLYGIDPDFTGGLTVEEFLEVSRGEA